MVKSQFTAFTGVLKDTININIVENSNMKVAVNIRILDIFIINTQLLTV